MVNGVTDFGRGKYYGHGYDYPSGGNHNGYHGSTGKRYKASDKTQQQEEWEQWEKEHEEALSGKEGESESERK